ncbi:hypothetical protein [Streptomyces sp. NBRC 110465]|uniref:hypothetical protein n=1 Tax=Streptomyces sp. NBRC 110465 TaxID=1897621 RepID=UPI000933F7EF|nr:hypothetical protein [Streptomyces sp. NBRC 110465]
MVLPRIPPSLPEAAAAGPGRFGGRFGDRFGGWFGGLEMIWRVARKPQAKGFWPVSGSHPAAVEEAPLLAGTDRIPTSWG